MSFCTFQSIWQTNLNNQSSIHATMCTRLVHTCYNTVCKLIENAKEVDYSLRERQHYIREGHQKVSKILIERGKSSKREGYAKIVQYSYRVARNSMKRGTKNRTLLQ